MKLSVFNEYVKKCQEMGAEPTWEGLKEYEESTKWKDKKIKYEFKNI